MAVNLLNLAFCLDYREFRLGQESREVARLCLLR
jgi:hypothetical protein